MRFKLILMTLMFACAFTVNALADITADDGLLIADAINTVRTSDGSSSWFAETPLSSQWDHRGITASGGQAFIAAVDPVFGAINESYQADDGNKSELRTTITGLTVGELYEVWVIYTHADGHSSITDTPIKAGLDDGTDLTIFKKADTVYTGLKSHGTDWGLFEAPLGYAIADASGEISVLVDHAGGERCVYHGVAWEAGKSFTSNLTPAAGAGSIAIDTSLEWTLEYAASATFNVYLGTTQDLSGVTPITTTDTSTSPALLPNTTYYWRVDVDGGKEGAVQSFTTIGQITNQLPADGAVRISMNGLLTWTGDDASVIDGFNVYFGQTNPPALQGLVTEQSYPTGILAEETAYYWQVIPVLGGVELLPGIRPITGFTTGKDMEPLPALTGLVKHVDASTITGLNDGDPVTVWTDISTIANDPQAPEGREPTYKTASINSLPVVQFDGIDDYLVAQDNSKDLFSGDQPFTVFMVTSLSAYGTGGHSNGAFGLGNGTGTRVVSMLTFESPTVTGNRLWGGNPKCTSSDITLGTPVLVENSYAGGGLTAYGLRFDGANKTIVNTNTSTHAFKGSSIVLGQAPVGYIYSAGHSMHYTGDIAELLVFNRIPSDIERNHIGYYLANKYGLPTSYVDPGSYATNLVPGDSSIYVNPTATLTWEGANGTGLTYEVYIDTDNDFSDVTAIVTTDVSTMLELSMDTTYFWRVDVVDGNVGTVQSFTTDGKTDTPDPADGTINVEQNLAAITWRAVDVAGVSYNVYIDTDPNFFTTVPETVTENSFTPAILLPDTKYSWKVVAVLGEDSVTSDIWSFTTGGVAASPIPADGAQAVATDLVLSWIGDRNPGYVDGYDVYFGETETPTLQATVTETSWQTPELTEGTTYFWKVEAKHEGAVIKSGQVWTYTTGELLGYWPLDNDACDLSDFDLSAGVVYAAGSTEAPLYGTPGTVGTAAYFNGTSVIHVKMDPNDFEYTNQGLTVACWLKMYEGDDKFNWNTGIISKNAGQANGEGWSFYSYDINGSSSSPPPTPSLRTGGSIVNSGLYSDNKWHFVVATIGPTEKKIWIDGVEDASSASNSFGIGTAPLVLGGRLMGTYNTPTWDTSAANNAFRGYLDDVRIFSYPLTESQIVDLYATGSSMAKVPSPADGEEGVSPEADLGWLPGDSADIAKQVLYYGLKADGSDATVVELATDADSYDIPGSLELYRSYYWHIDSIAADDSVIWAGETWIFRVLELKGDLNLSKIVEAGDLQLMAAEWLTDDREIPSSENGIVVPWTEPYNDGEDVDINTHYESSGPPYYGTTYIEIETDPSGDPNYFTETGVDPNFFNLTATQTLKWHMDPDLGDGVNGGEIAGTFSFPNGLTIDQSKYSKIQLWMRPHMIRDNGYHQSPAWMYFAFYDEINGGAWALTSAPDDQPHLPDGTIVGWTEASEPLGGAGRWVKIEWTGKSNYKNWNGFYCWIAWRNENLAAQQATAIEDAYIEFGDIILFPKEAPEGEVGEPDCIKMSGFNVADLNEDCFVDLKDFDILAQQWLMDASNL